MAYSSVSNSNTSLKYEVRLNGETIRRNVPAHHVESVVYQLQSEGLFIEDETWDDEDMVVDLLSRDEDLVDDVNEVIEDEY